MTSIPLSAWWPVARGRGARMRASQAEDEPTPLPAHVGLWLDRMLPDSFLHKQEKRDQEWTSRRQLYRTAVKALAPAASPESDPPAVRSYRALYAEWRAALEVEDRAVVRRCIPFVARSRILLHTASNSTVTDGTVLLHHTYGVPYIPGSALKGALRSRLDKLAAGRGPEAQRIRELTGEILGRLGSEPTKADDASAATQSSGDETEGLASLLDFYDALWIPDPPPHQKDWSPLALDIVNPHHPTYYTEREGARGLPGDSDEPVPVQRLSVAPRTRFLVVVEAPSCSEMALWLDWLLDEVLVAALADDGIGAWTSSGYGRLERLDQPPHTTVTTSPKTTSAPTADQWQPAQILYDAGRVELTAILPDQKKATALPKETRELLEKLDPSLREAIQRRRKASAEVRVGLEGISLRIIDLRPAVGKT